MDMHPLTITGILLFAIGTYLIHLGNQKKSANNNESLRNKLEISENNAEEQLRQINLLKEKNEDLSSKLDDQRKEILNLSKDNVEITNKAVEIFQTLTGGESFPIISYGRSFDVDKPETHMKISLMVHGINPLYDVTITHLDITRATEVNDKWDRMNLDQDKIYIKEYKDEYSKARLSAPKLQGGNFNISNIYTRIGEFYLPEDYTEYSFHTIINTRNGRFNQTTILKKDINGWYMSDLRVDKTIGPDGSKKGIIYKKSGIFRNGVPKDL